MLDGFVRQLLITVPCISFFLKHPDNSLFTERSLMEVNGTTNMKRRDDTFRVDNGVRLLNDNDKFDPWTAWAY